MRYESMVLGIELNVATLLPFYNWYLSAANTECGCRYYCCLHLLVLLYVLNALLHICKRKRERLLTVLQSCVDSNMNVHKQKSIRSTVTFWCNNETISLTTRLTRWSRIVNHQRNILFVMYWKLKLPYFNTSVSNLIIKCRVKER